VLYECGPRGVYLLVKARGSDRGVPMSTEATVFLMVGLTSPLWVQLSWELFRSIRTRRTNRAD
jgi:hypothetical protein